VGGLLKLFQNAPDVRLLENVYASKVSRWRTGGKIRYWLEPQNETALSKLISLLSSNGVPFRIIGETSNLLVADEGVHCPIICFRGVQSLSRLERLDNQVHAGAGVYVPKLAWYAARNGLSGIEHVIGIPGTFGGLIYMNGGSLRKNIGDVISSVRAICLSSGKSVSLKKEDCDFSYRKSVFQNEKYCIIGASMMLSPEDESGLSKYKSKEILFQRRKKFPLSLPNCGSVFSSSPEMYSSIGPAGAVIESCDLKGVTLGGAMIASEHANFIVNKGAAKSEDILQLILLVVNKVREETGFQMTTEVQFLHPDGRVVPAHAAI
jgi:UDP-N-acetylmuramate dehydrogenase